jgi:C4-dicarboxylate transporter, DctM subunit
MNPVTIGIIGILIMLFLLAFRVGIGLAMGVAGTIGLVWLRGLTPGLEFVGSVPYTTAANYTMSAIPLFVVMGNFAFYSGISKELFFATYQWLGHMRGGLAIATTAGCAGFAAVSGSSVANAVTMGTVALPEMKKYKYDPALATGCVAAGGTLGILIPPSIGFIIYSMLSNQSITKLFMAGIAPGVLLALLFGITIYIMTLRNPLLGPPGPSTTLKQKLVSLKGIWLVLLLFVVVIGGMYVGVFTPTEGAGIGAFASFVIMVVKQGFNKQKLTDSLLDTGGMVAMIYLILMGANIFSYFIALSRLPATMAQGVAALNIPAVLVFVVIMVIYLFLGCIMDTISMIIITVPIFLPIMTTLGFNPIWFGVIIVIQMEMGLITPPVGVNVFVISGISKGVRMESIFRGIIPFLVAMLVSVVLLYVFPQIALFLPNTIS